MSLMFWLYLVERPGGDPEGLVRERGGA